MFFKESDRAVLRSIWFWISLVPQIAGIYVWFRWAFPLFDQECLTKMGLATSVALGGAGMVLVGIGSVIRIRLYERIERAERRSRNLIGRATSI